MLHVFNEDTIIVPQSGRNYSMRCAIDPTEYPQVHDFYEVSLVLSGSMKVATEKWSVVMEPGMLLLIRPGDIHSRYWLGPLKYINLAFSRDVIHGMFEYMEHPGWEEQLVSLPNPICTKLSSAETLMLAARLEKLNLLPVDESKTSVAMLRVLMIDIIMNYIMPEVNQPLEIECPGWLKNILQQIDSPSGLSRSLDEFAEEAGITKEHLCRSFKKYMGVSPSAYVNARRLNYAANLMSHTDMKIVDVAYECGFQSMSRFYHAFRNEFGLAPLEYRKKNTDFLISRSERSERNDSKNA